MMKKKTKRKSAGKRKTGSPAQECAPDHSNRRHKNEQVINNMERSDLETK